MSDRYRWMLFVDGENLTIRAQNNNKFGDFNFKKGDYWEKDIFFWIPSVNPNSNIFDARGRSYLDIPYKLQPHAIRSYYYTALQGDDPKLQDIRKKLRKLEFDPQVFKKINEKSKGVDISIAKDLLSHGFRDNYDLAVLIAGDRDYLPLVDELKRLGKIVCICFFASKDNGMSEELKLAADHFIEIDGFLFHYWKDYLDIK